MDFPNSIICPYANEMLRDRSCGPGISEMEMGFDFTDHLGKRDAKLASFSSLSQNLHLNSLPYLPWSLPFYSPLMGLKTAEWLANSVTLHQTQNSAVSHVGLHCLLRPVCHHTEGKYGNSVNWPPTPNIWICQRKDVTIPSKADPVVLGNFLVINWNIMQCLALWVKFSADNKIFFLFPENRYWHFIQFSMKYQILFSGKN